MFPHRLMTALHLWYPRYLAFMALSLQSKSYSQPTVWDEVDKRNLELTNY